MKHRGQRLGLGLLIAIVLALVAVAPAQAKPPKLIAAGVVCQKAKHNTCQMFIKVHARSSDHIEAKVGHGKSFALGSWLDGPGFKAYPVTSWYPKKIRGCKVLRAEIRRSRRAADRGKVRLCHYAVVGKDVPYESAAEYVNWKKF